MSSRPMRGCAPRYEDMRPFVKLLLSALFAANAARLYRLGGELAH